MIHQLRSRKNLRFLLPPLTLRLYNGKVGTVYSFTEGVQWLFQRKLLVPKVSEGGPTFSRGGGVNFSQGGPNANF